MVIWEINEEEAANIIANFKPLGLFIVSPAKDDDKPIFVGMDNSTGDAWVEEFSSRNECESWLRREL